MSNNTDWLTPTERKEEKENEVEQTLLSVSRVIDKEIAAHKQAKAAADDKGKFGTYRYETGVISGLNHAREIVSDYLAGLWGM